VLYPELDESLASGDLPTPVDVEVEAAEE